MSDFNTLKQQKKESVKVDRARKKWVKNMTNLHESNSALITQSLNTLGKILYGRNNIFRKKYNIMKRNDIDNNEYSSNYNTADLWYCLISSNSTHDDIHVTLELDYKSDNMADWKAYYKIWVLDGIEVIISPSDLNKKTLEAGLTQVCGGTGFRN